MQNNNSKFNSILLGILIILVALGIYLILMNNKQQEVIFSPISEQENIETVPTRNNQPQQVQQPTTQVSSSITSTKFGLKYPANAQITEGQYLSPGQISNGVSEVNGSAQAQISFTNTAIMWGGAQAFCMPDGNEFGIFEYGVSTTACVKSMRADIFGKQGYQLTSADKKIFGNFVLENN
jgi:hypothetical protein